MIIPHWKPRLEKKCSNSISGIFQPKKSEDLEYGLCNQIEAFISYPGVPVSVLMFIAVIISMALLFVGFMQDIKPTQACCV